MQKQFNPKLNNQKPFNQKLNHQKLNHQKSFEKPTLHNDQSALNEFRRQDPFTLFMNMTKMEENEATEYLKSIDTDFSNLSLIRAMFLGHKFNIGNVEEFDNTQLLIGALSGDIECHKILCDDCDNVNSQYYTTFIGKCISGVKCHASFALNALMARKNKKITNKQFRNMAFVEMEFQWKKESDMIKEKPSDGLQRHIELLNRYMNANQIEIANMTKSEREEAEHQSDGNRYSAYLAFMHYPNLNRVIEHFIKNHQMHDIEHFYVRYIHDKSFDQKVIQIEIKSEIEIKTEIKSEIKTDEINPDEIDPADIKSDDIKSEIKSDEIKFEIKSDEIKSDEIKFDEIKPEINNVPIIAVNINDITYDQYNPYNINALIMTMTAMQVNLHNLMFQNAQIMTQHAHIMTQHEEVMKQNAHIMKQNEEILEAIKQK